MFFPMAPVILAEGGPETYSTGRYWEMVQYSPFTIPAEIGDPIPEPKDLENWSLVGVRKYQDEQFVTIANLKDRSQRIEVPGAEAESLGFSLLEVEVARSFLNTKVRIQKGRESGWLEYDPKFVRAKKASQKAAPVKESKKTELPPTPGKRIRYVPKPK